MSQPSSIRAALLRFVNLFRKRKLDGDLSAELESHLQFHIDDNLRAGMSPSEARRNAHLKLGGLQQTKEAVRDTSWAALSESLLLDLRFSLRILTKKPAFTATAILTLAIGISAATVVFSAFYNLLFQAFSARDANRLVVPVIQDAAAVAGFSHLNCTLQDADLIREQNQVFEDVVAYITAGGIVLANDGPRTYQFNASRVSSNAFEFYGVSPLLGRSIAKEDGIPGAPPVFVISFKTWRSVFNANPQIIGRNFIIDGEPRTLVGVMPQRFQAFGPQEQIWIPITRISGSPPSPGEFQPNILARLKPGVTLEAASADFAVISKRLAALHPENFPMRFKAQVISAVDDLMGPNGGGPVLHSDVKQLLYVLLAAVLVLLLIACTNVANLLLANAVAREREIATRSALGASRKRLIQQFLIESGVLASAACILGCFLSWFGIRLIAANLPRLVGASLGSNIGAETVLGLNPPVLLFAVFVTLISILLCGCAPALHVLGGDLQAHLAGSDKNIGGIRHGKFRAALIVAEVALSIALLIGSGLLIRTFYLLTHVELGFNPQNVLLVVFLPPPSHSRVPAAERFATLKGRSVLRDVVNRLRGLPGVSEVSIEDTIPGYGPAHGPQVTIPGGAKSIEAGLLACDENLVKVLELRLLRGRWLTHSEVETAQLTAVINDRLAKEFFPGKDPVGQEIKVEAFEPPIGPSRDTAFQIVGVVADIKSVGPQQPAIPMIFLPYTVRGGFALLLKTVVNPAYLTPVVQEQVWAVDRDEIVALSSPLEDFLQKNTYAAPEFGMLLCSPLSAITLLLVWVGVFSSLAYNVSLQTREIGIRMALGCQPHAAIREVVLNGMLCVSIGLLLGTLASLAITRLLRNQIWGISTTDPWTFVTVILFVFLSTLLACYLPARRASKVDPMVALRYE